MTGSGSYGKDGSLRLGVNVSVIEEHALVDKGLHGGAVFACCSGRFWWYEEDVD